MLELYTLITSGIVASLIMLRSRMIILSGHSVYKIAFVQQAEAISMNQLTCSHTCVMMPREFASSPHVFAGLCGMPLINTRFGRKSWELLG